MPVGTTSPLPSGRIRTSAPFGSCWPAQHRIPIHFAARALETAELAGEVADGLMLYLAAKQRYHQVLERLERGARKANRELSDVQATLLIPAFLHENIEWLAIFIHGSPQVVALASDADKHLVQMPGIARSSSSMPQLLGKGLAELEAPLPDRFIADDYVAFGEELFSFPETAAEAVIQPHSVGNNLGWETVLSVETCGT